MRLSYPASAMRLPVLALVLGTGLFGGTAAALPTSTLTVTANCGQGQTISDTLKQGAAGQPLMVVVQGTCNENLVVDRDDVTLQGDPSVGGAVNGPDAGADAIIVTGRRVTITGLTVTGGKNGVVFFQGASGTVDKCTVQANPRDGISIEAASATIINSSITGNSRVGVLVTDGGSARIGVSNLNVAAGNTISGNGSNGVHLSIGAGAFIEANTISGNGTPRGARTAFTAG